MFRGADLHATSVRERQLEMDLSEEKGDCEALRKQVASLEAKLEGHIMLGERREAEMKAESEGLEEKIETASKREHKQLVRSLNIWFIFLDRLLFNS